jgi:hypothetical protein
LPYPKVLETATVVAVYRGGGRSLDSNNRPVSVTSVVWKQMEHVIAKYPRKIEDKKDWSFQGRHGFRPEYSTKVK